MKRWLLNVLRAKCAWSVEARDFAHVGSLLLSEVLEDPEYEVAYSSSSMSLHTFLRMIARSHPFPLTRSRYDKLTHHNCQKIVRYLTSDHLVQTHHWAFVWDHHSWTFALRTQYSQSSHLNCTSIHFVGFKISNLQIVENEWDFSRIMSWHFQPWFHYLLLLHICPLCYLQPDPSLGHFQIEKQISNVVTLIVCR